MLVLTWRTSHENHYDQQPSALEQSKIGRAKAPLRLKDIGAIRVRLQIAEETRDLALFDLAIDSKLRACDLTKLRVRNVSHGEHVSSRAIVMQQKTQRPVQFEITEQTQLALQGRGTSSPTPLRGLSFSKPPTRLSASLHPAVRPNRQSVDKVYWTRSSYVRHPHDETTKASLIYRGTRNLRAVQLLLGHTKLESTVRYLGIEVDDALEMAEQTEV
jgi:site-specific recombinase XerC